MLIEPTISQVDPIEVPTTPELSDANCRLLAHVRLTAAAERHLVSPGKTCPDHAACRRLAFARYLYLAHRITDDGA